MLKKLIREALLQARKTLLRSLSQGLIQVEGRGSFGDFSRRFDLLTEKAIIDVIRRNLEEVYIVSEEIGHIPCEDPKYYALIDPVDGSTNASHGLPFYASSIIISKSPYIRDVIAAGVIDHSTGTIFLGDRENGALIDGKPASVRKTRSLSEALIFVDLGTLNLRKDRPRQAREWCVRLIGTARHARFFAAANLEICYILQGKADGFACVSEELKLMDFCAPMCLVKWSGGAFRIIGEENPLLTENKRYGVIVASTRELLEEMSALKS